MCFLYEYVSVIDRPIYTDKNSTYCANNKKKINKIRYPFLEICIFVRYSELINLENNLHQH